MHVGGIAGHSIAGGDVQLEGFSSPNDRIEEARRRDERAAPYLRFYRPIVLIEEEWHQAVQAYAVGGFRNIHIGSY